MGNVLERLLYEAIGPLNVVGNIRGRGLFWSVEFMLDGPARIPFPPEAAFCARIVERALALGLNILGNLGQTGDVWVDHVIISPAYIVSEEELREIVHLLRTAIEDVTRETFSWLNQRGTEALA